MKYGWKDGSTIRQAISPNPFYSSFPLLPPSSYFIMLLPSSFLLLLRLPSSFRYSDVLVHQARLWGRGGKSTCCNNLEQSLELYAQAQEVLEVTEGSMHPKYAAVLIRRAEALARCSGSSSSSSGIGGGGHSGGDGDGEGRGGGEGGGEGGGGGGRSAEAFPLFQEAREILAATVGRTHVLYMGVLNGIASLLYRGGQYEEALPLYHEVCTLRETIHGHEGEAHVEVGRAQWNLFTAYDGAGRGTEAQEYLAQAAATFRAALGPAHRLTVVAETTTARCDRRC